MKTMEFYEPAMCCSTGLCGVNVDPELLRVAVALEHLKQHDIIVQRYNLSSAPQAFIMNKVVAAQLQAGGMESLPLVVVDGQIVIKKRYPTNTEFCSLLGVPCEWLTDDISACCQDTEESCCCGSEESDCCGGDDDDGGNNSGGCCCGGGNKGGCCE